VSKSDSKAKIPPFGIVFSFPEQYLAEGCDYHRDDCVPFWLVGALCHIRLFRRLPVHDDLDVRVRLEEAAGARVDAGARHSQRDLKEEEKKKNEILCKNKWEFQNSKILKIPKKTNI
jgi:hypothetical protein